MSRQAHARAVDVVVVGAGLSGLSAARALADRYEVVVVEARDRVGGRTVGHMFANGCTVEMGGQWIGSNHGQMLRLIDELGLATFPTYDDGAGITVLGGQRYPWDGASLGLPAAAEVEIERLHGLIDELAQEVPLDAPWNAAAAAALDAETVESWLTAETSDPVARAYFRVLTPALFAAETHELPWLYFLFYARSGGSLDYLITTTGGAQHLRVVGGSHRVAAAMAAELPSASLVLGEPVDAIRQDSESVRVSHASGEVVARRAILTLPPSLAGRLTYQPPLLPEREALTEAFPMGSVIKFQARYDEPWWRSDGLSGQVISFDDPVATTFDNTPADAACGVLLGFAEGDTARQLGRLGWRERRDIVLGCLGRFFGPRAESPREFAELDWSREEFTGGCYGGHPGVGVLTKFGSALREPQGRIHWAGAETAEVSSGYMDGAVRSGLRAAAEVAAGL